MFATGDREMLTPFILPGIQVYVRAPPAVKLILLPEQTVGVGGPRAITGKILTIKLTVLVLVQPNALPAVTVYKVVEGGVTITVPPAKAPGDQVKEIAPTPDELNVAELPTQTALGLALTEITGPVFTVTLTVAVLLQPTEFPVTV